MIRFRPAGRPAMRPCAAASGIAKLAAMMPALIAVTLMAGCDGRPSNEELASALEAQIRADVRSHAPMVWDRSGQGRPIEPSMVRVRELEIQHAAFITDYWSVGATFVLDLGYTEQDQRVRVRLARQDDGSWHIRQLVQR
jgi:hypothetical protein